MASIEKVKSKETLFEYEKGQDPESKVLRARKFQRIGQIVWVIIILAGIYFAMLNNIIIPYMVVAFFTLALMKRPDLEKIESKGLKSVITYFGAFLKFGLLVSLIWLVLVIWTVVTPYILIPIGIFCYIAWRVIHIFTPVNPTQRSKKYGLRPIIHSEN